MNRGNLIIIGNRERDSAKGIAFVKSNGAKNNILKIVEEMKDLVDKNGVAIEFVYQETSGDSQYDQFGLRNFLEILESNGVQVIVIRSLNEITDDMSKLERFIRTVNDMGIWIYCLAIGPVPVTVSHAERICHQQISRTAESRNHFDPIRIGDNLRKLREDRRLTQLQVVDVLGISYCHYARLEEGVRCMSMKMFFELMNFYRTDANTILGIPAEGAA